MPMTVPTTVPMLVKKIALIGGLIGLGLISCSRPDSNQTSTEATPSVASSPSIKPLPAPPSLDRVVVDSDGKTEITLPTGWQPDKRLHDEAQLQAYNPTKEAFVIVLSEERSRLPADVTLAKHSELTRSILMDNLTDADETQPLPITKIGTHPAVQYQITGTIQGIDVVYLHTTVETADRFHQILVWTAPSKFDPNEAELQRLIGSFRERETTAVIRGN